MKTNERNQELAQYNDVLKKQLEQQKKDVSTSQYSYVVATPVHIQNEAQVRHLEQRVQLLTEDNDELRRDLGLQTRLN